MISTTELMTLLGTDYDWFHSKRRRLREQTALKPETAGKFPNIKYDDIELLPVKDIDGGRWAKYDAEDAINMAAALALAKAGVSFVAAARMVQNTHAAAVLSHNSRGDDYWIAKFTDEKEGAEHANGTWREVTKRARDRQTIALNVSAVLRQLQARAAEVKLSAALGWQ
jgi:hypothetical protein